MTTWVVLGDRREVYSSCKTVFTKYYGDQNKENWIGGACSTHGKYEKCIKKILVEKPQRNKPLERTRYRWEVLHKLYNRQSSFSRLFHSVSFKRRFCKDRRRNSLRRLLISLPWAWVLVQAHVLPHDVQEKHWNRDNNGIIPTIRLWRDAFIQDSSLMFLRLQRRIFCTRTIITTLNLQKDTETIKVAQDTDQWLILLKVVAKIRVPQKAGNSWANVSFSRRNPLYGLVKHA